MKVILLVALALFMSSVCVAQDYTDIITDIMCTVPNSQRGFILGGFVRLVFHDASGGGGGMNGCFDTSDTANLGLSQFSQLLEPIFQNFQSSISRADIWALAGVIAVYVSGGPAIPLSVGRVDCNPAAPPSDAGLIPNATNTFAQVLANMQTRMGLTTQEITALMGAHSLGSAEIQNSGFQGNQIPKNTQFSNAYYKLTLRRTWQLNSTLGVNQEGWQSTKGNLIRFDTDVELLIDPSTCTEFGGSLGMGNCQTNPLTNSQFKRYAHNQNLWFGDFSAAFQKMMNLGYSNLTPVQLPFPNLNATLVCPTTPAPTPAATVGKGKTAPSAAPAPAGKGKRRR